jgi:hypothetical protein
MLDPQVVERIRSIFLQDKPGVTIAETARLLGMSGTAIRAAVRDGEIEATSGCRGPMIDAQELAEQAALRWPIATIEETLGRDAARVLPVAVRTERFTGRLPPYVIAALRCLAEENGESADAFLSRELQGVPDPHRERLAAAIAGFAEAVDWPLRDDRQHG